MLYEASMRKKKGIAADKRIIEKRRNSTEIEMIELSSCTIENLKEMLEDAKKKWAEVVENGKKIRECNY